MMRYVAIVAVFVSSAISAQSTVVAKRAESTSVLQDSSITVRSSLVVVPALVRNGSKELVYSLRADDFLLTDNGVAQKLQLEEDTGGEPIALVVCVETGGFGREHLGDYRNLVTMLETMVTNVEHTVAVVGFDSTATVLHGFTSNLDFIGASLNELDEGDQGAAILDGLITSVNLLRTQPVTYRRAVLLLSETIDRGSHAKLDEALRAVSDTNTVIYSVAFSSSKADLAHENRKFGWHFQPPLSPGPKHGCFSRDLGTDADGKPIQPEESRAAQNFNCIEELLPPLRLAKLAEVGAKDALRQNVSEAVAGLTGGEAFSFNDAKSLQSDLFTISNHIPNRYVLSFHPRSPAAGFHAIAVQLRERPGVSVEARSGYWVEDQGAAETVPKP
jgi:VWFA-related protein